MVLASIVVAVFGNPMHGTGQYGSSSYWKSHACHVLPMVMAKTYIHGTLSIVFEYLYVGVVGWCNGPG